MPRRAPAGRGHAPKASDSKPASVSPVPCAEPQPKPEPFAFADFTWLTGNPRTKDSPLDTKAFTGEFRVDIDYIYASTIRKDHTIEGSSEIFRSDEVQVTQTRQSAATSTTTTSAGG